MNKLAEYILIFSVALSLDMGLSGSGVGSIAFARKGTDMAKSGDDEANSSERENSIIIKDINIENKFTINIRGTKERAYTVAWFFYPQNEEEASKIKNRFGGTYPFPLGSKKSGLNQPVEFFISIVAADGKVIYSGNKMTTEISIYGYKRLGRVLLETGFDPGSYNLTIRPTSIIKLENFSMGYEVSPH